MELKSASAEPASPGRLEMVWLDETGPAPTRDQVERLLNSGPTLTQQVRRLVRRSTAPPAPPAGPTLNPLLPKAHPGCRLWLSPQEMRLYGIRHQPGFIGKREAIKRFRRQATGVPWVGGPVDPSWMPAPRET